MPRPAQMKQSQSLTLRVECEDIETLEAITDVTPRCSTPALVRRGIKLVIKEWKEVGTIDMKTDPS
ncbi:MAG: hypothetical protein F4219_05785 [Gammaproteobacteria bacterium]|nr:hypothetical protein [Gammaproteobacteria bacterium]